MHAELDARQVALAADHAHPAGRPGRGIRRRHRLETLRGIAAEEDRVVLVEGVLGGRSAAAHAVASVGWPLVAAARAGRPEIGEHSPAGKLVPAAPAPGRTEVSFGATTGAEAHHAGAPLVRRQPGARRPAGRTRPRPTTRCALNRTSPANRVGRKNNGTPGRPLDRAAAPPRSTPLPPAAGVRNDSVPSRPTGVNSERSVALCNKTAAAMPARRSARAEPGLCQGGTRTQRLQLGQGHLA